MCPWPEPLCCLRPYGRGARTSAEAAQLQQRRKSAARGWVLEAGNCIKFVFVFGERAFFANDSCSDIHTNSPTHGRSGENQSQCFYDYSLQAEAPTRSSRTKPWRARHCRSAQRLRGCARGDCAADFLATPLGFNAPVG